MLITEKPDAILKYLHEASTWFHKHNIDTNATRFELILNNFGKITSFFKESSINEYINNYGFENYFFSLIDAISFIDVYNGLNKYKGSLPKSKIRESLRGPLIPNDEILGNANVNSRNYFFELEVASKLLLAGIKVNGFNDVNVMFEKNKIFIECKRLLTKSNIGHNISYAFTQLSRKLSDKTDKGIIALSFDKAYNFDDKLLATDSIDEIQRRLNDIGNIFIKDYSHLWINCDNVKIIGIILFITFGTVFDKTKILKTEQTCIISLRSDTHVEDKELLYRFYGILRNYLQPAPNSV